MHQTIKKYIKSTITLSSAATAPESASFSTDKNVELGDSSSLGVDVAHIWWICSCSMLGWKFLRSYRIFSFTSLLGSEYTEGWFSSEIGIY